MPIEIIPGQAAFASLTPISRWPSLENGADRYLPYPVVAHTPGFSIGADDKLFTIGSCFAREVERALVHLGMQVLSSKIPGVPLGSNVTNKYTSRSIVSDLRLAFDPAADPTKTIYRQEDGNYINLAFGGRGAKRVQYTEAEIHELTLRYYENLRKLRDTNVVVVTLGLVESWFDKKEQIPLNLAPMRNMLAAEPDRFEVHVLSYEDIVSDMEEILSVLRRECQPGVRFLTTVSPVPLATTFRSQDCLQADMYSKCVQRAAIEQVCMRHDDVAYFPSFELVRLASPQEAWTTERDFRHVRPETVERIMKAVIDNYVSEGDRAPTRERLAELKAQPDVVIRLVEDHMRRRDLSPETLPAYMQLHYARALAKRKKRKDKALAISLLDSYLVQRPHVRSAQLLRERLTS